MSRRRRGARKLTHKRCFGFALRSAQNVMFDQAMRDAGRRCFGIAVLGVSVWARSHQALATIFASLLATIDFLSGAPPNSKKELSVSLLRAEHRGSCGTIH